MRRWWALYSPALYAAPRAVVSNGMQTDHYFSGRAAEPPLSLSPNPFNAPEMNAFREINTPARSLPCFRRVYSILMRASFYSARLSFSLSLAHSSALSYLRARVQHFLPPRVFVGCPNARACCIPVYVYIYIRRITFLARLIYDGGSRLALILLLHFPNGRVHCFMHFACIYI